MSVVIDMVMPDNCLCCPCSEGYGCGVDSVVMTSAEMNERPNWCPIIAELPARHGRLLDERSVKWAFDDAILIEVKNGHYIRATSNEVATIIKSVPTIVGAEGDNDNDD